MAGGKIAKGFIGSSSEGLDVARNLANALDALPGIETRTWQENIFQPSSYTLDRLIARAQNVDFAVLVATPDDLVTKRGKQRAGARDNVLLEFGLFVGALGRQRTFLLPVGEVDLPSDVLGLTTLQYNVRQDGDISAAVRPAVEQVRLAISDWDEVVRPHNAGADADAAALRRELDLLKRNASAQGWVIRKDGDGTFRLENRRREKFTFTYEPDLPRVARAELRAYAAWVSGAGLRVHHLVRTEVVR